MNELIRLADEAVRQPAERPPSVNELRRRLRKKKRTRAATALVGVVLIAGGTITVARWSNGTTPTRVVTRPATTTSGPASAQHSGGGVSAELPEGWEPGPGSTDPNPGGEPMLVFTAATYPLTDPDPACPSVPANAYASLGPTDMLILVYEFLSLGGFPEPRRDYDDLPTFVLSPGPCVPENPNIDYSYVDWVRFTDSGRALLVQVVYGVSVRPDARSRALEIVNSLVIS